MNTNFTNQNWLIKTFTDKLAMGDTNPIVMQNDKDNNRYIVITPIFKNGFLVDVIETEFAYKEDEKPFVFPRNLHDVKNLFHRGKERLEDFFCYIGIAGDYQEVYLGKDKNGDEIWEIVSYDTWKRVI